MGSEYTPVKEIKEDLDRNQWVNVHVTCTELWETSSEKMAQTGRLTDSEGDSLKFFTYTTSGLEPLEQGESYVLDDAMTINDKDEDAALLLKADTHIEEATSPRGGADPEGPGCADCGEAMPPDAYHEDGNAPEIGWEYWHCPNCGHKMRPEALTTPDNA